jgi:spore germination protein GerM
MTRTRVVLHIVLAGCLTASCGVPAQNEPHAVELPRQPFTTPASGAATSDTMGDVAAVLCFTRNDRLVEVVRRADAVPTAARQIEDLVAGPTQAERNNGVTTSLTGLTLTVDAPAGSGQATVEVTEADEGSARSDEVLVYGQIVCTLTSRADVSTVAFVRGGTPLDVPRADGSLAQGPLDAGDYRELIGPE